MGLDNARLNNVEDVFSCVLDEPEIAVEVRSSEGITKLSDLDGVQARGEIHVAVLSSSRDLGQQLGGELARARKGDIFIIYAPTARVRLAVIHILKKRYSIGEQRFVEAVRAP
ncbi:hypothetical protein [Paraburkholderia bannensis]|uniref:hypothetical protein n=1 Tax=Paraburkholderia bannensis TaxID=765414 RepID=UPI002AB07189|nr:hypothetical protein [Paraburkholderia bannensis]